MKRCDMVYFLSQLLILLIHNHCTCFNFALIFFVNRSQSSYLLLIPPLLLSRLSHLHRFPAPLTTTLTTGPLLPLPQLLLLHQQHRKKLARQETKEERRRAALKCLLKNKWNTKRKGTINLETFCSLMELFM